MSVCVDEVTLCECVASSGAGILYSTLTSCNRISLLRDLMRLQFWSWTRRTKVTNRTHYIL